MATSGTCAFCGEGPLAPWKPGAPAVLRCRACGGASLEALPAPAAQAELYQEAYYQKDSGDRFLAWRKPWWWP